MAVEAPQESVVEPPPQGKVAKNAVIYLSSQIVSWLVALLTVSIIPRSLGEKAYGQYAFATTTVTTIGILFALGIDPFLVREVGRERAQAERMVRATLGLRLVLVLPFVLCSLLTLLLVQADAVIWRLGGIAVVSGVILMFAEPIRSALAGLEQAQRVSLTDVLLSGSLLLAIPFLAFGPISLVLATLAVMLVILAMRFQWARQTMRLRPVFDVPLWKQVARGGVPFFVNNSILQLYGFLSLAILRHLTNDSAVGVYAQAGRLFGTFLFVPTALGMALLPSLSRLAQASPEEFRRMESRVLGIILIFGLPVMTGVILLAEPLCRLLYTKTAFVELPLTLQTIAFAIIPVYIVTVMYQFLVAQSRNSVWTWFLVGTVGLYCVLSYLLIPFTARHFHNAPAGAAAALVGAESCSAVCALALLRASPFTVEMTGRVFRALLATACMAAVLWLTRDYFLLIPAALGTATFLLTAWWLKALPPEEQSRIIEMAQRKLRRR